MLQDFVHVTVLVLAVVALYLVLSSKNSEGLASTGVNGANTFVKTLQGR